MKSLKLLASLALAFCVAAQAFSAETVTVRDFRQQSFDYGYEGWKDLATTQRRSGTGTHIMGPARGGVGAFFPEIVDVASQSQLEVKIKRGPSNTEGSLYLKLIGANNKSYTYTIDLSKVSDTEFTPIQLDLSKAKSSLNLEEIKQMQIQGSFNPALNVEFELESIIATGTAQAS